MAVKIETRADIAVSYIVHSDGFVKTFNDQDEAKHEAKTIAATGNEATVYRSVVEYLPVR